MAPSEMLLLFKPGALGFYPRALLQSLVAQTCEPSTGGAKAGGSPGSPARESGLAGKLQDNESDSLPFLLLLSLSLPFPTVGNA